MRAPLVCAALVAAAAPALAEPVSYECTIRHVVSDTTAEAAKPGHDRERFTIDAARGIGCVMAGGFCNPLYSKLKVTRTGPVILAAGTMMIGDSSAVVVFHPDAGRATITYTFASVNPVAQRTYISGPGDCRKLDLKVDLDAAF